MSKFPTIFAVTFLSVGICNSYFISEISYTFACILLFIYRQFFVIQFIKYPICPSLFPNGVTCIFSAN
jgi:hypothetical protein